MTRKLSRLGVATLCTLALASCNGTRAVPTSSLAQPQSLDGRGVARTFYRADIRPGHRITGTTPWMSVGAAKTKTLLYVSDADTDSAYVYDFKTGKHVGTLSGIVDPAGECVDAKGDVFLTTYAKSQGTVIEYAHGGAEPIKSFVTNGYPVGCSISPNNGNLAVANEVGSSADLQIWKGAAGQPKTYTDEADCNFLWSPGYDGTGNLFVQSGNSGSVCELPKGANSLVAVPFDHEIGFPGSTMWDGKYITFTDQLYGNDTAIYQATQDTSGALKVSGTTVLTTKRCGADIVQPFVVGKKNTPSNFEQGTVVVGGNIACYGKSPVWYWQYPRGGKVSRRIRRSPTGVVGQAVSIRSQ